jgi:hypothetical protein
LLGDLLRALFIPSTPANRLPDYAKQFLSDMFASVYHIVDSDLGCRQLIFLMVRRLLCLGVYRVSDVIRNIRYLLVRSQPHREYIILACFIFAPELEESAPDLFPRLLGGASLPLKPSPISMKSLADYWPILKANDWRGLKEFLELAMPPIRCTSSSAPTTSTGSACKRLSPASTRTRA